MYKKTDSTRLQHILNKAIDNKLIFGTSVSLRQGEFVWSGVSGNFTMNRQFYIASTTKLFVTAMLLQAEEKGLLNRKDLISRYLPSTIMKGLHLLNNSDYSDGLTIENLMAHTSGIPDYFQQKRANGISLETELLNGNDLAWSMEQCVEDSKLMKPAFAPGAKGKAIYSDTNYQLLGKILETIYRKDFGTLVQELICKPIGLKNTYLYSDIQDKRAQDMYFKNNPLIIPKAMVSFGSDGGIVSTSEELLQFSQAFFGGSFFSKELISGLKQWNRIFFPLESGIGMHRFKLPWFFSPFKPFPELFGHSGLSGAFAFYCPAKDLYLAGTVNQISQPQNSYRLMLKLVSEFEDYK
jgi:CubicO group peptidase (beta-lactamase class C family)